MLADPKVNLKSQELLTDPYCLVRQHMSLKGLLTATEKQVHTGELHQRPIQCHLKNHWRIPESLDARSYPSTFKMVTPSGTQPFRSSDLYRCLKRRLGGSLRRSHCKRTWSESKLHINYLELKVVFLAQDLRSNKIVLKATDNTIVVAYINREGGMSLLPLCALL